MERELNPRIFSSETDLHPESNWPAPVPQNRPSQIDNFEGYMPLQIKELEAQMRDQKKIQVQQSQKTEALLAKLQDFINASQTRFERLASGLKAFEEAQNVQIKELQQKISHLAKMSSEKKQSDVKVMELIERHNSLVRGFENKMSVLTRTLSEQEFQLLATTGALDDARAEIAKLKDWKGAFS